MGFHARKVMVKEMISLKSTESTESRTTELCRMNNVGLDSESEFPIMRFHFVDQTKFDKLFGTAISYLS